MTCCPIVDVQEGRKAMAWKATGDERIRSFRAYRELESEYQKTLDEKYRLEEQVRHKDSVIRSLAAELASAPTMPSERLPESAPAIQQTDTPPPKESAVVPRAEPKVARNVPMSQVLGGRK